MRQCSSFDSRQSPEKQRCQCIGIFSSLRDFFFYQIFMSGSCRMCMTSKFTFEMWPLPTSRIKTVACKLICTSNLENMRVLLSYMLNVVFTKKNKIKLYLNIKRKCCWGTILAGEIQIISYALLMLYIVKFVLIFRKQRLIENDFINNWKCLLLSLKNVSQSNFLTFVFNICH